MVVVRELAAEELNHIYPPGNDSHLVWEMGCKLIGCTIGGSIPSVLKFDLSRIIFKFKFSYLFVKNLYPSF